MKAPIVRIKARVGEVAAPHPDQGKFVVEMFFRDMADQFDVHPSEVFGPYDTEEKAREEMQKLCKDCCDFLQRKAGVKPDGAYIDFKNGGVLRNWNEQVH